MLSIANLYREVYTTALSNLWDCVTYSAVKGA
jgi:hypothetical protein